MNEKIKFNGVLTDNEKDPRDYNISMFIPGKDIIQDEEFCLKLPKLNFILNQYQFNSCVGHSFALCKSILEYNKTNKWLDIDPYMIYGTRYNSEYSGEGMYSWQGAKVLLKDGAFLRRDFNIQQEVPQIIKTVTNWKSQNKDKVKQALDLQISAYYYVYSNNEIKRTLKQGMPISIAYPIYDEFYNPDKTGRIKIPGRKQVYGYHQMTIVGWTKDNYWIVVNSWGIEYGLKGVYLIPFEYNFDSAIAVSDNITPIKYKAKRINFHINDSHYFVDGTIKEFDSNPYIKNDRTYVPVRFISEALGASVEWKENDKEVIIRSEEGIIKLKIGSTKMEVNNRIINNDVAPEIVNDRTMLPVRFISEALNCSVNWNNGNIEIISL